MRTFLEASLDFSVASSGQDTANVLLFATAGGALSHFPPAHSMMSGKSIKCIWGISPGTLNYKNVPLSSEGGGTHFFVA
jgi:hypothetical protein